MSDPRKTRVLELFAWLQRERIPGETLLRTAERVLAMQAFEDYGGNMVATARVLGISRKFLYALLHESGLTPQSRTERVLVPRLVGVDGGRKGGVA